MNEAIHELGLFYFIMQVRSRKMSVWQEIRDSVDRLLTIQRTKGVRGLSKRLFTGPRLIDGAFISVAEFEAKEVSDNDTIDEDYRSIYPYGTEQCFQSYIDEEIKGQYSYPTEQINQLISFVESRRVKSLERFVVLIAAVLGGSIGALLTILLASGD